jgi:hypothetical protein
MHQNIVVAIGHGAIAACLLGTLASCNALSPRSDAAAERQQPITLTSANAPETLDELLQYVYRLDTLQPEELEREYTQTSAGVLADDASAASRIRVALLLSRVGTSFRNDARAQTLLEQVIKDPRRDSRTYHGLASFLLVTLNERDRLEDMLADERRQRQELQHKLEQLKVIERDFDRRIPAEPIKQK